jgi:hypothetical protein
MMTHAKKPSEKILFWRTIFLQAGYFIKENPSSWFFGLLLSLPTIAAITLESLALESQEIDPFLAAPKIMGLFLIILFLFFISESGLILSFKKTPYSSIEHLAATGALIRWYFLFLLILLGFFALFFSPFIIAPPETQSALKYVSTVFFLLVASAVFILKMLGGFYLILSKLSLKNALRSSATLFTDHFTRSVTILIITSILSISVGLVTGVSHDFLSDPIGMVTLANTAILLFILALSTFFNIFFRTLWYFFFQAIAAEKPKGWQGEKKMVEESMVPAEDEA